MSDESPAERAVEPALRQVQLEPIGEDNPADMCTDEGCAVPETPPPSGV